MNKKEKEIAERILLEGLNCGNLYWMHVCFSSDDTLKNIMRL
jgi:hypothetical protein|tara:strand:+ start:109 stop:234 length:126 start_codon:yes stop_codon:yes gene_type:complete